MKTLIQKVPVPLAGVMLGCAALGNLLQSYSETVRWVFGGISAFLFLLLLLKIILFPSAVREDMQNPITAGVAGTFPMGLMLLSVYAKPFLGTAARILWFCAIALHLLLIVYFTLRFLLRLDIKKVFTSYFIVYVGIAAAGVTAPAHGMTALGTAAFWFGFVSFLALLFLVGYRYIKHPGIPEPAQPLFCIFTAPCNLCLTAYLQSVQTKSLAMVAFMAVVATLIYTMVLLKLFPLLKLKFYPSYASFTFPFVISAIALKQATGFLSASGYSIPFLPYLVAFETAVATLLVCYTLIRFFFFLRQQAKAAVPA